MSLTSFGKCSICTLSFELDNISSLKCGHTYHLDCISKWTDTAKNCPKCRMKNTTRDITRLFVDEPDKSNSFFAMNNNNNDAEISRLRDQLKEAEDSKKAMEQKFTTCKIAKERLEAQVEREKKSAGDQIKSKDRLIKNLERMLQDQEELKHQLELAQRRLKASDFYGLISSKNGADEEKIGKAIDKYSAPNGNPDINVFFKSVQKQFRTIQKTNTLLNAELKKEKQEKNKLAAQLEEANKELESRKRRIQTTNGTSPESPIGRKPLRQTYGTPIPNGYFEKPRVRPSFGFEGGFSFDADSDELFNNKENEDSDIQVISDGPIPMPKKMVMNKSILIDEPTTSNAIEPFSFGDFPTTSNAAAKPTKKKQPYLGDELIEIFSPSFMEQANGGHNKK